MDNYPLNTRDDRLQSETFSPKIPAISMRSPTTTNSRVRRDKVGGTKLGGSTASGYDESTNSPETNMRMKFVNTTSLGRDD